MEKIKLVGFIIQSVQIIIGIYFILIGFKVINKFKNKPTKEKEWYSKYGAKFKIGGLLLVTLGIISLPFLI